MAVLHQFQEVKHLLLVKGAYSEVVDDEQVGVCHLVEELGQRTLHACHRNLLEEFEDVVVAHLESHHACLVAQYGGEPALAGSGRAGDDDGDPSLDVGTGCQFHDAALVQSATGIELGLHDGCLIAEVGSLEEPGIAVLLSLLTLGRQQELQSVAQGHAVHAPCLDERPPAVFHAGQSQFLGECCDFVHKCN